MKTIILGYEHKKPGSTTHLEECVAELNGKGGLKRPFPNENMPRIPLVVEIDKSDSRHRKVTVYPETLGRHSFESLIHAEYDIETGKETVLMPYGWCGLHLYFEKKGFRTGRQ